MLLALAWLVVGAGRAPLDAAPQASSVDASVSMGAELYANTCKVCHGEAGIGGVGPALRGRQFTRAYVRRAMSEGQPGSMMPEFTRAFTAAQMNAVAQYVASLQASPGPSPDAPRGNAADGEAVFFARSARSCYVCHAINGRGGNVGPDLTPKVRALTPREIFQRIILVPHRASDPAYATVRLTTTIGQVLTGIHAGETGGAIHFYDTSSLPPVLRTIPREEVVATEAQNTSVMPSDYASRLTLQQLLDLVAFLKSAGGAPVAVTLEDVLQN